METPNPAPESAPVPPEVRAAIDQVNAAPDGPDPLTSSEFLKLLHGAPAEPVRNFVRKNLVAIARAWQRQMFDLANKASRDGLRAAPGGKTRGRIL